MAIATDPKPARAARMLADAQAASAALEASTELRCRDCRRVLLKYDAPIGRVTLPCRRCGTWNDFSSV